MFSLFKKQPVAKKNRLPIPREHPLADMRLINRLDIILDSFHQKSVVKPSQYAIWQYEAINRIIDAVYGEEEL